MMQKKPAKPMVILGFIMLFIAIILQFATESVSPKSQGQAIFNALVVGIPGLLFIVFEIIAVIRAVKNKKCVADQQ